MARRRMIEPPPSRLALWSRRLALFGLVVVMFAIVLVRGGFVETLPGFVMLAAALLLAAAAIMLALGAFVAIWIDGNPGLGSAVLGLLIGAGLIAYPAYIAAQNYHLPALADISTDTADPPAFDIIARLRPRGANPVAYPGPAAAQQQQAAYPDIAPLAVAAMPMEAYNGALEAIGKRRWRIVNARAPQRGRGDGRIEAVALTPIMGFRDDVVVRVRATADGSVVDVRSASRYGAYDFGANARRVRSLIEEIEEEIGAQSPAQ